MESETSRSAVSRRVRLRRTVAVTLALAIVGTGTAAAFVGLQPVPPQDASKPAATSTPKPPVATASALAPAAGSIAGGDTVEITGVGLQDVSRVTFGGVESPKVFVMTSERVTAVAPRALEYQPSSANVEIFAGAEPVDTAAPLTFDWEVVTPVDRQMQYAFSHWDRPRYNLAEYGTFNGSGGDCVNFVSQTLIARGWQMTNGWHNYNAGADYTSPWIFAPAFEDWMRANAAELGVTEIADANRDQVKVGDIAMFDWNNNGFTDHVQIVSDVSTDDNGKTTILMVGHNLDTNWRDADEAMYVDHDNGEVYYWSIP